eukprot:139974_1
MCFCVIIYSFLVNKVLFKAAKYTENQRFGIEDMKVARKLLIINTIITLYFIYSSAINVYFALYPLKLTLIDTYISLFLYMIILLCICWMYHKSMHKLIKSENLNTSKRNSIFSKISKIKTHVIMKTTSASQITNNTNRISYSNNTPITAISNCNNNNMHTPNSSSAPSSLKITNINLNLDINAIHQRVSSNSPLTPFDHQSSTLNIIDEQQNSFEDKVVMDEVHITYQNTNKHVELAQISAPPSAVTSRRNSIDLDLNQEEQ